MKAISFVLAMVLLGFTRSASSQPELPGIWTPPQPRAVGQYRYHLDPTLTWEMQPRFGLNENAANPDRLPDLRNTFEYVHNLSEGYCTTHSCASVRPHFNLTLDASSTRAVLLRTAGSPVFNTMDLIDPGTMGLHLYYQWTGPAIPPAPPTTSPRRAVTLPEGQYPVSLTVSWAKGVDASGSLLDVFASASTSSTVVIEDFLVVSIGDSYSSGEGNPERAWSNNVEAKWADDGRWRPADMPSNVVYEVGASHIQAHRSTLAWPAQAAMALERADDKTSVTFVSVASTGATVNNGILSVAEGSTSGSISQLERVKRLVGQRSIDSLLVSIGGNDIGFSPAAAALVVAGARAASSKTAARQRSPDSFVDLSHPKQLDRIRIAVKSGDFTGVLNEKYWRDAGLVGLDRLPSTLEALTIALEDSLRPFQKYLLEYPNVMRISRGDGIQHCPMILEDVVTGVTVHMDQTEIRFAENEILEPLNAALWSQAARFNWNIVSTKDFASHGYCAQAPLMWRDEGGGPLVSVMTFTVGNPYPLELPRHLGQEPVRWVRTATEAVLLQGGLELREAEGVGESIYYSLQVPGGEIRLRGDSKGLLHPNEYGHQAIRDEYLRNVALPVEIPGVGLRDPDDQLAEARPLSIEGSIDRIAPSSDVDAFAFAVEAIAEASSDPRTPPRMEIPGEDRCWRLTATITFARDGRFAPALRLFDRAGVELIDKPVVRDSGDGPKSFEFLVPMAGRQYVIGVSDERNVAYDITSGLKKASGGGSGEYRLDVKKSGTTCPALRP